jgi:hypothetical protein
MSDSRHARQVILPEIGEAGQARIEAGSAVVDAGRSGEIEALYLAGAGVGRIVVADAASASDARGAAPFDVRDEAARDVALGAWRALATLRALVARKTS